MVNYFKEYNDAQTNISLNKQKVIQNHISNYPILEEALGIQYFLNRRFTEYFQENFKTKEKMQEHFAEISSHLLFFYNVQSLQIALHSVECDFIHQSAVNIRTVFEAIPKMYYISLFPEKVQEILIHEYVHHLQYKSVIEELKDQKYIDILNGKQLPFDDEESYKKFKNKYKPQWFREELYTKGRVKKLKKLYAKFSNSTHPNISRNETAIEYTFTDTDLFFQMMKSLSYFNLEAYLEGNSQLLYKMNLHLEILTFLNRMGGTLKTIIEDVYFLPNKEKYKLKLKTISTPR